MIATVAGRLVEADADGLVVEVGGVGLRVHASAAAVRAARDQPEAVRLHTHLVVREDALTLYGFAGQRERRLFVALLGVSGLGPAKALALLSGYPVDTLQRDGHGCRRRDCAGARRPACAGARRARGARLRRRGGGVGAVGGRR